LFRSGDSKTNPVVTYGFLVAIQAEEGTSVKLLSEHIEGACTWVEGVGKTEVDYMGIIPEEEDAN